jgi:hypothetical protein
MEVGAKQSKPGDSAAYIPKDSTKVNEDSRDLPSDSKADSGSIKTSGNATFTSAPPTVSNPQPSIPKSDSKPVAVEKSSTTKSAPVQYEQTKVTSSASSSGKAGWQVETVEGSWADKNFDRDALSKYVVEAIVQISEDKVKAWKPDGSPHPDLEGYIRLKLENSDQISIPIRYKKKTRIIIFKFPSNSGRSGGTYMNVSIQNSGMGNGNLYELSNGSFSNEFRYEFIPVSVPVADKYANVPAMISISATSKEPVPCTEGRAFTVAGTDYKIVKIRPYKKTDGDANMWGGSMQIKMNTTIEITSSKNDGSLNAGIADAYRGFNGQTLTYVNDAGDLVTEKVDPTRGYSSANMNRRPMVQNFNRGNSSGSTVFLVTNLNQKSLKSLLFSSNTTLKASFNNIPLDDD